MPGTVLTVGVATAVAAAVVACCAVAGASVHAQRLAGAADAAALAAADAASGAVSGVPCERAAEVAAAAGAGVVRCTLDGLVATVTVGDMWGVLPASATARAGPPPAALPDPTRKVACMVCIGERTPPSATGHAIRQEARHRRVTHQDAIHPGLPR